MRVVTKSKSENREFFKRLSVFAQKNHETFWFPTLFLSVSDRQRALMILRLDGEFHRIFQNVSEPMIAHIRFQWWRDETERLIAGGDPHETDPSQCLYELVYQDGNERDFLHNHLAVYDDLVDQSGNRHPHSLFTWLVGGRDSSFANAAGDAFLSLNTGKNWDQPLGTLQTQIEQVRENEWPWACLFSIQKNRQLSRFRYVMNYVLGKRALARNLGSLSRSF